VILLLRSSLSPPGWGRRISTLRVPAEAKRGALNRSQRGIAEGGAREALSFLGLAEEALDLGAGDPEEPRAESERAELPSFDPSQHCSFGDSKELGDLGRGQEIWPHLVVPPRTCGNHGASP